jgi:hypothetical protein
MSDLASFQREFASALLADDQAAPPFRSQAFAVYRNTSARGIVEALRASFPTVDMLVGEEMFTEVALDFRREQPPAGPVLSDYGADFAAFLARDSAALPPSIGGEAMIGLHPAARFAWLASPAMTIWQAHRDPWKMTELDLEWAEEGALFTRLGPCVRAEQIDAAFHRLLLACVTPAPIADIASTVAAAFPLADVPRLFQRGVASGALLIQ